MRYASGCASSLSPLVHFSFCHVHLSNQIMACILCMLQSNPHKRLRHLYGPRMMAQYKGVPLGELSPHVYAIAEQVVLRLCNSPDKDPQPLPMLTCVK